MLVSIITMYMSSIMILHTGHFKSLWYLPGRDIPLGYRTHLKLRVLYSVAFHHITYTHKKQFHSGNLQGGCTGWCYRSFRGANANIDGSQYYIFSYSAVGWTYTGPSSGRQSPNRACGRMAGQIEHRVRLTYYCAWTRCRHTYNIQPKIVKTNGTLYLL